MSDVLCFYDVNLPEPKAFRDWEINQSLNQTNKQINKTLGVTVPFFGAMATENWDLSSPVLYTCLFCS